MKWMHKSQQILPIISAVSHGAEMWWDLSLFNYCFLDVEWGSNLSFSIKITLSAFSIAASFNICTNIVCLKKHANLAVEFMAVSCLVYNTGFI